jgi:hypothetical protein
VTWVKFDFNEISRTQAMRGKEDLAELQRYLASLSGGIKWIHLNAIVSPRAEFHVAALLVKWEIFHVDLA